MSRPGHLPRQDSRLVHIQMPNVFVGGKVEQALCRLHVYSNFPVERSLSNPNACSTSFRLSSWRVSLCGCFEQRGCELVLRLSKPVRSSC